MPIADIISDIYFKTKTNSADYPAADMLIHINRAYNDVVSQILSADGRWQWDDDNQSDFSIATTALVSSQKDYSMAVSHLKILRVELLPNGETDYIKLDPKDEADESLAMDTSSTGTPAWYDLVGGSIFLYPTPDYSQASSLKVYFQRGPDEFTSGQVTTGTKKPGFASLFHALIPLKVSFNYCVANGLPMANGYLQEILRMEKELKAFYGKRDKDDRSIMRGKRILYI